VALLDLSNYKSDRDEPYPVGFVMVSNHGMSYHINPKTGRAFSNA